MDSDTLTFAQPQWFIAILVLVALVIFRQVATARSAKLLDQLVASRLKAQLLGSLNPGRRMWKFWCFVLGLLGVIVALARPQFGYQEAQTTRKGLDVMFAMDTSRSMLAEDIQPNRMDRAKFAVLDLLEILEGDRIGLIGFAGDSFLQCPLTTDYAAFRRILDEVDTNLLPTGGTNIANAIREALKGFMKSESDNRALVLITDGEELDQDAVAEARKAYDDVGIRIFTMGFGTPDGTKITITENGRKSFVVDQTGQPVISRLNEALLEEIASAAGGFYGRFDGTPSLQRLASDGFGSMTREDIDAREQRRAHEYYQWPLSVGLFLLLIGSAIHETPKKRQVAFA